MPVKEVVWLMVDNTLQRSGFGEKLEFKTRQSKTEVKLMFKC